MTKFHGGGVVTVIMHAPEGLKPAPEIVTSVPGNAPSGGDPLVGLSVSGPGVTVNEVEAESP